MFYFLVQGPFVSMIPAMNQTISKNMRETQQFEKSHFLNESLWSKKVLISVIKKLLVITELTFFFIFESI